MIVWNKTFIVQQHTTVVCLCPCACYVCAAVCVSVWINPCVIWSWSMFFPSGVFFYKCFCFFFFFKKKKRKKKAHQRKTKQQQSTHTHTHTLINNAHRNMCCNRTQAGLSHTLQTGNRTSGWVQSRVCVYKVCVMGCHVATAATRRGTWKRKEKGFSVMGASVSVEILLSRFTF